MNGGERVKVEVKGKVMEVKELNFKDGLVYSYRIYQPGELELVEVQSRMNGISVGQDITAEGRLAVRIFNGKPQLLVRAEKVEVV